MKKNQPHIMFHRIEPKGLLYSLLQSLIVNLQSSISFLLPLIFFVFLSFISSAQPLLFNSSVTHTTYGNNDGAISLNVISGQSPFTYQWSSNDTTSSISNLSTGIYTVTVFSANDSLVKEI